MAEFIFMLTRYDQTIEDCLAVLEEVVDLGVGHIGFKDLGVSVDTLRELNGRIKASGALSYLEVVSSGTAACVRAARLALELGVDRLMGGQAVAETVPLLAGAGIAYYPFPGRPAGHPTALGGTPEQVAEDCRRFEAAGCAGVDLLAYRATEADPLALVRAARSALKGCLVVAGSIDSPRRVADIVTAGADAFTVGSAVFEGRFNPRRGSLRSQLREVLAACAG